MSNSPLRANLRAVAHHARRVGGVRAGCDLRFILSPQRASLRWRGALEARGVGVASRAKDRARADDGANFPAGAAGQLRKTASDLERDAKVAARRVSRRNRGQLGGWKRGRPVILYFYLTLLCNNQDKIRNEGTAHAKLYKTQLIATLAEEARQIRKTAGGASR